MKKRILLLILTSIFFATGCGTKEEKAEEVMEEEKVEEAVEEEKAEEVMEEESMEEEKEVEIEETTDRLENYIASIQEQSNIIQNDLENRSLKQTDLNIKSQELYELWDGALNALWSELKSTLPKEEFAKILEEQREWIEKKEEAIEKVGKEVEGGSMFSLVVNEEASKLTENVRKAHSFRGGMERTLFYNLMCMLLLILYIYYSIIYVWKIIIDIQTQQYL